MSALSGSERDNRSDDPRPDFPVHAASRRLGGGASVAIVHNGRWSGKAGP